MRPDPGDRTLSRVIARWFRASGRDLPWRTAPRDPYRSLVSEFMLQQTQVKRVLERFGPFVERFPDVRRLAAARESSVLAMWSGLGYYRRARSLHAAARVIVSEFGGEVPRDLAGLMSLPGVGRYTAGAISSIVFNRREPIVDGNIARVLLRLEGCRLRTGSSEALSWAWDRAGLLVADAHALRVRVAELNEGLMELGATICTPRNPACRSCPVRDRCVAASRGDQNAIPLPKVRSARSVVYCEVVLVVDESGRRLVERRSTSGMWGGLWQAPTWERVDRAGRGPEVAKWLGVPRVRAGFRFTKQTTHREVQFRVWMSRHIPKPVPGRRFLTPERIAGLGLSNPQRRILLGDVPAVTRRR